MSKGTLFIISAPSGAGKTSLVKALVDTLDYVKVSISHTTRDKRPDEREGIDYYFVTPYHFNTMVKTGEFLEYAHVFENYYGTSRSAVNDQLARDWDVILEIDWQGARQVRNRIANCQSIFILPPSRAELEMRLRKRGQDTDEIIQRRMCAAENEIRHFSEFDYIIINDTFDQALKDLASIFIANRLKLDSHRQRHKKLLNSLLRTHLT